MSFSGKTKVGNLDGICGGCRWRSHKRRISAERRVCVVWGRGRYEDVFGLDISVEEMMGVDVIETGEDLVQNAFDTPRVHAFVVPRFHELVQVAVHELHAYVQLFTERIQENVECGYQVGMCRQCSEKDDFSQFQTRGERVKGLFHGLDGNLQGISWIVNNTMPYQ
jgi:hypothetical protein